MFSPLGPCRWCGGAGYEDYPSNRQPCRIEGHADVFDSFIGPGGGNINSPRYIEAAEGVKHDS